ncbi:MAG TPA: amino acid adenylation domain-containing protein, partial [Candidatus Deferrimicrobium sp.]|nr:amino acid adenylation domain-containing protein [Candidatus Deferrimicrobium sp.]
DYMLKDSNAKILINKSEIRNSKFETNPNDQKINDPNKNRHFGTAFVLNLNHLNFEFVSNFDIRASDLLSSNLAYIIYTSGSTGKPKGVLTMHANVTRVVKNTNYIDITSGDRVLQLSNYAFDGSVFDIYGALLNGAALVLIKKETAAAVERLAETIKREQVTVFLVTTALFNVLVDLEKSSLKNVRKILFGGERVSVEHTRKALAYLGKGRIVHVYGPTETTVYASYYFIDAIAGDAATIPIGKPLSNTIIYIVDKDMNPVPIGVRGEIYIGGEGTARGYLNNPELTKQKFLEVSEPFFKKVLTRRRLYKTGDLGRWLPDGNIEFLGRIDQQIKIRGFRVELGEIESRLLNYPGIKEAVVLAREEAGGDKSLCAYTVSESEYDETGIREFLLKGLPEYMIPSYFLHLEKIPLNLNGKVDRKALPKPGLKVSENYTAPRNEVEKKLVGLWSEILGLPTAIGIDENFFRLGGHSLKATILASRIHKELNVIMPLAELFKTPTIRGLSQYINDAAGDNYKPIRPAEEKEYYGLSSAQKRLYILQQMDLSSTAYNMSNVIPMPGEFQVEKLAETIKKLINRHESLRTSFHMIGAQPVQKIHKHVEFEIEQLEIRPFDLSQAPLLRVGVFKNYLLVDMHHIISDGVSQDILIKDFLALYRGEELVPLRVQYRDFAEWQNSEKENLKQQEDYWLREFAGDIPVLNLPTDFPRAPVQRLEGDTVAFDITREETGSLNEIARSQGGTLFMVLLAIFNIFLAKVSNREVIIVGTPTAGRKHADLEHVIGMFVNTLALYNYPSGDKTFSNFFSELQEKTLQAFENQDYQFEDLVEKVVKNRDQGRNPLFDVMFALQNFSNVHEEDEKVGSRHQDILHGEEISKFDLSLDAIERGEKLYFIFAYCTKLFRKETILRFIQYFKKIMSSVIDDPGKKILALEIISAAEKQRLLFEFNQTATGYPKDKTIHQLFAEQVSMTPDRIALVGANRHLRVSPVFSVEPVRPVRLVQLTYLQLNEQSNRVAWLLVQKGVLADNIIGIKIERSIEMIIGMLGILKSGGAYLPIDPDYPQERVDYMLKDSNAKIMVGNWHDCSEIHHSSFIVHHSSQLAYVIYTSGSTGRPKGVMIEHRNVARLVKNSNYIQFSTGDRLLPTGAVAFDISTFEIWSPLLNGFMLMLASKDVILNAGKLKEILVNHDITILHLIPQLFNQLAAGDIELFARLRCFLVGGDLVSSAYINALRKKYNHLKILHMYGPTENTTFSTYFPVEKDYELNIPIGTPVANSTAYIIDKYGHLQPIGVMGELCVGGEGIARGYLNHPELTFERFIFFPNFPLYRTGDLARWLSDGNIEFLGRIDQQIKIRGFRVELGEIENRLANYPGVKETVVSVLAEEGGDKSLCAYIVSEREWDPAGLREFLLEKLPDYMIPSYFVRLEEMPLTPNGKVDRKALPKPGLIADESYVAPRDEIEKKLVELWAEILGKTDRKAEIGIDDNFFQLGGHSLKATVLVSGIHRELNVIIALGEIFKAPTIRKLGEYLKNTKRNIHSDIDRNLVLLKEGLPGRNHLFFIHDGRGEIEGYIELC